MKLSRKIQCVLGFAEIVFRDKGFEFITFGKDSKGYGLTYHTNDHTWESVMKWGKEIADQMDSKKKVEFCKVLTGITDGISCSIAEDMKKSKKGAKAD